jgi:hypothetical protein
MTAPVVPNLERRRRMAGGAFVAFAVLAIVAGFALAIAAIARKPDWEGALGGVFGGFFVALLIMGAGAWIVMWLVSSPKRPDTAGGEELEASLSDVLAELEKARLDTIQKANARAIWRVPLCIAGGIVIWVLGQFNNDPGDVVDLAAMIIVPGIMGYVWASMSLSNQYARLYKERVLPRLAAKFGDLSYRPAVMPDMAMLKAEHVFRDFDSTSADDEVFGTHRGLPVRIVELKLESGSGKERRTTFDGLLVEIDLPRDTNAITAVVSDAGAFGNFRDRMRASKRQRVRLEDPVFEKIYEVYGTDQIAARALLHPAFMEKLLALGELIEFSRPLVLCAGRKLHIAMPKRIGRDLFEPPSFQKPAASREMLVQLRKDIEAVLAAADAVIDLDHRFEIMARQ